MLSLLPILPPYFSHAGVSLSVVADPSPPGETAAPFGVALLLVGLTLALVSRRTVPVRQRPAAGIWVFARLRAPGPQRWGRRRADRPLLPPDESAGGSGDGWRPDGDRRARAQVPRLNPWRVRRNWRRDIDALDGTGPSLRAKLTAGGGAATLVLVVALLAYWGFRQFQYSARSVAHTTEVRAALQHVDAAVSEAEAAGRGYLVNGLPRFADAYRVGIARGQTALTTAERLTVDNPSQQTRLARLDTLLGRRFAVLDSLVALRRTGGAAAVIAGAAPTAAPTGGPAAAQRIMRGIVLADSVRQLVAQADSAELRLLTARNAQLVRRSRVVTLTLAIGSVTAFALVLLVLQSIRRDVAAREAAQARVREQADALALQAERLEEQQIVMAQHVQEQQALNTELGRVNAQLARATRRRDRLIRQLERSNTDLDQFAYVASHDLKAPLRGIANLSSWIEEDLAEVMTDDAREQMELLRGRVHRMEALIDGILQYSRAGRVRTAPEPVDTGALVRDVIELLAPPEDVAFDIADAMPLVLAERVPLQQVFLNLIGNAVKYGRKGGGARVGLTWAVEPTDPDAPDRYQFSVTDNGPGIAPQYHDRVFGIFQTLQSRDQVEGTGIGLSVVKKIVEGQGGRVWVESAEGEGATFHFTWPAAPAPNPAEV